MPTRFPCCALVLIAVLAAVLVLPACNRPGVEPPQAADEPEPMQRITLPVAGHEISVEVAQTPAQLTRGLQHRQHLRIGDGMLFVLPPGHDAKFWMKDVLIPLDIVFIEADGMISDIHHGVQPCDQDPCPFYRASRPVRYALELPAGQAAQMGLVSSMRIDQHVSDPDAQPTD